MSVVIPGGAVAEAVKFAGQDLKALGLYCEVDEGIYSGPPVRGSNLVIPYAIGRRWTQKFYDQRPVTLTGQLLSTVSRQDFQGKVDTLKQLFQLGTGEQKLEVQWQDGSYRYVMADVVNTLGFQRLIWPTKSTPFSIELLASDPLWYSSDLEASLSRGTWNFDSGVQFDDRAHWFDTTGPFFAQTLTTDPSTVVATNGGTHWTRRPIFNLEGIMANPKILNQTNGYSVQVLVTTVNPTDLLVVDCGAGIAYLNGAPLASGLVVLGSSQIDWMHIDPGSNTLQVTLNEVTPSVAYSAQYSAAWL